MRLWQRFLQHHYISDWYRSTFKIKCSVSSTKTRVQCATVAITLLQAVLLEPLFHRICTGVQYYVIKQHCARKSFAEL